MTLNVKDLKELVMGKLNKTDRNGKESYHQKSFALRVKRN